MGRAGRRHASNTHTRPGPLAFAAARYLRHAGHGAVRAAVLRNSAHAALMHEILTMAITAIPCWSLATPLAKSIYAPPSVEGGLLRRHSRRHRRVHTATDSSPAAAPDPNDASGGGDDTVGSSQQSAHAGSFFPGGGPWWFDVTGAITLLRAIVAMYGSWLQDGLLIQPPHSVQGTAPWGQSQQSGASQIGSSGSKGSASSMFVFLPADQPIPEAAGRQHVDGGQQRRQQQQPGAESATGATGPSPHRTVSVPAATASGPRSPPKRISDSSMALRTLMARMSADSQLLTAGVDMGHTALPSEAARQLLLVRLCEHTLGVFHAGLSLLSVSRFRGVARGLVEMCSAAPLLNLQVAMCPMGQSLPPLAPPKPRLLIPLNPEAISPYFSHPSSIPWRRLDPFSPPQPPGVVLRLLIPLQSPGVILAPYYPTPIP